MTPHLEVEVSDIHPLSMFGAPLLSAMFFLELLWSGVKI